MLEDKIASKVNLVKRGITVESSIYNMCGKDVKTTSHLFCTCKVAWLVWSKCYEWVGLTSTVHQDPKLHFSHFRMMEEIKDFNRIWYHVWITVIGELCKQRNKKVFKKGQIDYIEFFTMV